MRNHWCALRQQQGSKEVALLATSQLQDNFIISGAFHTVIPRTVMGFSVAAIFTIGLIVLVVIRDQVAQCKTVMGSDEVNRSRGAPAIIGIEIRRPRQP